MQKMAAIIHKALEEREIPNLDLITVDNPTAIQGLLSYYPNTTHFSEWRYEMAGPIQYRYRPHNGQIGKILHKAYLRGIHSGLPRLTAVYSRKELSDLLSASN